MLISIEPVLIGVDHEHTSAYNRHERMHDDACFPDDGQELEEED